MIHPLEQPMVFPLDRPKHILIYPDGTRRYALEHGLSAEVAYRVGAQRLLDVVEWLFSEYAIPKVTAYLAHSSTLTMRPPHQVRSLYHVWTDFLDQCTVLCHKLDAQIQIIGDSSLLPKSLQTTIENLDMNKVGNKSNVLSLLVGYSARQEILSAATRTPPNADFATFASFLWVQSPVHLIIRTGGLPIIGDVLVLQSTEARLFFMDKLWPEITHEDIDHALTEFARWNQEGGRNLEERRSLL